MPEPRIALIGEAYGEEEAQWGKPFIGKAGKQLDDLLEDAGISRASCLVTNVFNLRPGPQSNDLKLLTTVRGDPLSAKGLPAILPGQYLLAEYVQEIDRLHRELESFRPNVAVLLGNVPCWALLQRQSVSRIRGTATYSHTLPWLKCLPTYHPAAVLRQYDLRHVTVLDLQKARREGEFPELHRPERAVHIAETVEDIRSFKSLHLDSARRMAFDIETSTGQITCIGFAPSPSIALVIPFVDLRKPGCSYWGRVSDELAAWDLVADILDLPAEKVGQNTLYDIQYLWQIYGIPVRNYTHDTMLLHHSLQPESDKGLGFLGFGLHKRTCVEGGTQAGEDD